MESNQTSIKTYNRDHLLNSNMGKLTQQRFQTLISLYITVRKNAVLFINLMHSTIISHQYL